jgi:adenine deaminase
MDKLNRFAVVPLSAMTRCLADFASRRAPPDLVITGASPDSELVLDGRELWTSAARTAAVKPARASCKTANGRHARLRCRRDRIRRGRSAHPHRERHNDGVRLCASGAARRHSDIYGVRSDAAFGDCGIRGAEDRLELVPQMSNVPLFEP